MASARDNVVEFTNGDDSPLAQVDSARFLDDFSRAELFAALYSDKLRFVPERKQWAMWDQDRSRWSYVLDAEKRCGMEMLRAVADAWDRRTGGAAGGQGAKLFCSARVLRDMLSSAKSLGALQASISKWDSKPYLLGVANGVLDLRRGVVRKAKPEDFMMKNTGVPYDPHAPAPTWERFLASVCRVNGRNDDEYDDFLWQLFGSFLVGSNQAELFAVLIGPGGTGKSTFLHAIAGALGDYAMLGKADMFEKHSAGTVREDIAQLLGNRIVYVPELPSSANVDIQAIKSLSARDKLRARHLHQGSFEFHNTASPIIACNAFPRLRQDPDSGLFRRLAMLPFSNVPEQADARLADKLHRERAGVLSWLVRGCQAFLHLRGAPLPIPQRSQAVLARLRGHDYSPTELFVDECLKDAPGARVDDLDIWAEYNSWFESRGFKEQGIRASTRNLLSRTLSRRGWEKRKGTRRKDKHITYRYDVEIRDRYVDPTDFEELPYVDLTVFR